MSFDLRYSLNSLDEDETLHTARVEQCRETQHIKVFSKISQLFRHRLSVQTIQYTSCRNIATIQNRPTIFANIQFLCRHVLVSFMQIILQLYPSGALELFCCEIKASEYFLQQQPFTTATSKFWVFFQFSTECFNYCCKLYL